MKGDKNVFDVYALESRGIVTFNVMWGLRYETVRLWNYFAMKLKLYVMIRYMTFT